ncbi:hypothetical protein GH714_023886 [Hevea brasiliensis]|uniref:Glycosyl transferase family 3 domain-containing protein n=1 Tax=Hevea brasiliensis TaxID=3981 RepID=A0A6A6KEI1_HEVBR|nr:hypothetical protein GH714_023886 [Hevea brasiliensis]
MKALLNPEHSLSIHIINQRNITRPKLHASLRFVPDLWIRRQCCLTARATLDSATFDQLGIPESDIKNPAVSSSYRSSKLPKPNETVLEAQARVCTGPTQTRPLNEDQAFKVLDTIFRSARGELKDEEEVSKAQLGAFFAAMTIRANAFPEATQWSEGEKRAMNNFWPLLVRVLPPDVIFIADPEGSIMGAGSSVASQYVGNCTSEMRLVGALREILAGGHLGDEEVQGVLRDVLPLKVEDDACSGVSESLLSAFLIGQRMNRETDSELKAYCLAFDDELGPPPVADVRSLTHYGEPYDGKRVSLGALCLLLRLDPVMVNLHCFMVWNGCHLRTHRLSYWSCIFLGGVTEEQMLKFMGANTSLTPLQAKGLLEDDVGFAYISQHEACPSLYSLIGLREHIKKRPPLATTEKVQQFVRARGKEAIVAGFYHEAYEEPLLMLMKRRGVHSGLVVKGEEGALSMTMRLRSANASKGLPVNYSSGFRSLSMASAFEVDGMSCESFNIEVNAKDYGFEPTDTPRTDRSVSKNIELGLAALRGEKGPAYDRIVLNAGMVDHLLGCDGAEDISLALDRAREAIDSGRALKKLLNYIKISHKVRLLLNGRKSESLKNALACRDEAP